MNAAAAPAHNDAFASSMAELGYAELDLREEPGVLALCDQAVADVRSYAAQGFNRVQDAWRKSDAIRTLAGLKRVTDALAVAYSATPFPFQTLNFERGSQQAPHADIYHFTPEPAHLMCGVWLALEDVHPDAGPLVYFPKSHVAPVVTGDRPEGVTPEAGYSTVYEPAVRAEIDALGFEPKYALLKKGQAFVWAANLLHGGSPVRDATRTRRSLVTHYFFEGSDYHTLMHGDQRTGRRFRRLPQDVRNGRFVWPAGGRPRLRTIVGATLQRALRRVYGFKA
ncbi:hypothetical protein U91I_00784 [alpha proteobacterium U9-1i]|nr:hypothetical protein U91I_00784 [alpha proteobacterium U9-1i]